MSSEFESQNLSLGHRNYPSVYSKHQRQLLMHAGLGFVLLSVIVAVIYFYVSHEHTIYVSDYAGYQNMTHSIVAQYRHSPLDALIAIARSMTAEYNAIFTIPLIPWMLILGESRIVYEIALGVVYLLPFSLILGALAVQLIRAQSYAVFWSTVLLALLTPMMWVPTLRGYPDTGAAVILAVALWIYLRDTRLKNPWQILSIGFLVTSSVLFRRHFAYAALAFFAAIAVQTFIRFAMSVQQQPKLAWRDLRTTTIRIGLTAFVAFFALITFGRPFLVRFLTVDYNALYASYTKSPLSSLEWNVAAYGWLVVAAAVIGFLLGARSRIVNTDAAIFIALFGSLTGLAWLFVARQTGEQYTLNFTPIIILSLSMLLWSVALRFEPARRRIALIGSIAYLGANLIFALSTLTIPAHSIFSSLFAMQESPFTRSDQAQVIRLVDYFRGIATNGEPIYVAASSSIMGKDTLVSAEHISYGWESAKLNVLYSPEIDSRDYYPLELLIQAQYVLVVDPFQYHLSPEQQRIVQVVYDIFKNNREFAQDFVELPQHFTLDEGAVASVYQRVRPTPISRTIKTLEFMQSYIQARPGGQPDWIILDQTKLSTVTLNRDHTYQVTIQLPTRGENTATRLLYIGTIPDHSILSGEVSFLDQRCTGAVLHLAYVTEAGELVNIGEIIRQPNDPPDFVLPLERSDSGFLLFTVENTSKPDSAEICPLNIDHLKLASE